jgi:glutamate-1-semialdehyde 2,1-aminomutase
MSAWAAAVEETYRARSRASARLSARAQAVLPGGDTRYGVSYQPYPTFFARGEGAYLWDEDGRRILDLNFNATSLIHGHAHARIVEAIAAQAARGTAWLGPHTPQVELAEALCDRLPGAESVRFTNSGTEATLLMAAVAREFTGRGRLLVLEGAYHGFHEPGDRIAARFNDTAAVAAAVRRHAEELAGVIVTPLWSADGFVEPAPGFLEALRAVTSECGALLLFDEIISFRLARGGAQERYGVTPDLTALGKIIGGGLPVGAVAGRTDVLAVTDASRGAPRVEHSGTFNGNPLTCAAGLAALELLTRDAYSALEERGRALRAGLRDAIAASGAPFAVEGAGSLAALRGAGELERPLALALLNEGVFAAVPRFVVSTVTDDADVELAVHAFARVLEGLPR